MSEDDAQAAADTMQDCADIKEIFTGAMGELPEEAQTCLEEQLTDERLRGFLVATFSGQQGDEAIQELSTAVQECVTGGAGG